MTPPPKPKLVQLIPGAPAPFNNPGVRFSAVEAIKRGHRIILYGPGGIGKSTLACLLEGKTAFVDADESLEILKPQLEVRGIPIPVKVDKVDSWSSLRLSLQNPIGWDPIKNIVMDTWSAMESWLIVSTLRNVKKDNDQTATTVEDYGYGKGYRHVFDHFLPILGDLDKHVRAGRNVVIIAHDETAKIPNPAGQDFIRWEPKMQHTDKASIRYRVKDWADHVLFLNYDMDVKKVGGDKDGKKVGRAAGSGTRTLHTAELPYFMAKSRTTSDSIDIELGQSPWEKILKG